MTKSLKASLRKSIVGIVMMTTVFSFSGLAAVIPVVQAATIVDGDVIQNPSAAGEEAFDVYIVKLKDGKKFRRLVLNPEVFTSYGHLKWENIKKVTSEEMNAFTISNLVKVEGLDPVYALLPNGDTGSKSWLKVTVPEFEAAGGDWSSVYQINAVDGGNYVSGTDMTTVAQVQTFLTTGVLPGVTPGVTPTPTPVVGTLSVALSADTPASGTLISGAATAQSGADLMHFTLTGAGTVTGIALKRIGVSDDATLSNVYLFDGATRVTDAASVSTGSVITFNNSSGLFTVNGTKTISVKSDIALNKSGQTVGVQLTGVTMTTGVVGGTLPISGNIHSIAAATLATIALSASTGSGNTDPANGLLVWQSTATVGNRDVLLTRLALRQIGSIVSADINNFKLLVDGTEVATAAALDANGYATFAMSKALATGGRTLKVTADIIGGSGRTVQLSLRGAYDISATDTSYGVGITATGTFPNSPTAATISSGSMTVVKSTASRSTNLTVGAADQSLATYTFTAFGEPIKVETLKVGMITNGTPADITIQDVKIMVNGSQVGSTTSVPAAASYATNTGTQFTTNFTVTPGTPATVEIRGNMVDSEGTDDIATPGATTVQAVLVGGTDINNGVPQVTITAVDVPTDTNVLGNSLTISSGSMTLAKTSNYGDQTIVTPQTAYKIGSFVLSGNSTEAVNLNTLYVGWHTGTSHEALDLSSLYVTYGGVSTVPKGTVVADATAATASDNSNSWSISKTLGVNESLTFDVYASIGTTFLANETIISTLAVAGTTALSNITTYADATGTTSLTSGFIGQTITAGTGAIAASVDASTPASALVDDSGTATTAAFKFAATNDGYTITDMTVTLGSSTAVSTVTLMDGITPVVGGSKAANDTVTYSGLNIPVAANGSKVITVQLTMSPVGAGAGATGGALLTTLTAATAKNSAGTNSTPTGLPQAGNAMYVYKALPIITNVALPTTLLTGGGNIVTLSKFTVSSSGGAIAWTKLLATVTVSIAAGDDVFTLPTLWDVTSGSAVQVTTTGSYITGLSNASGSITIIPTVEQQVSGSKTYELKATLAGTVAANDTVTTQITQPSDFAASVKAFKTNAAAGLAYYDRAGSGTAVGATDVRAQATAQYTTAEVAATGTVVGVLAAAVAKSVASYGVPGTLILTMNEGTTAETTGATTFTVTGAGSAAFIAAGGTCTPYTGTDYTTGVVANTTLWTAIRSIRCTATGMEWKLTHSAALFAVDTGTDVSDGVLTLTVTKAADYAIGSAVGATDSDVTLVTVAGVLPAASFVWSDVSAASHSRQTTDWTNGFLVQGLPNNTQSLLK